MESFSVKSFCEEPSLDKLKNQNVTKDDWKFIATYFDIKVSSSVTKETMRGSVVRELIMKGVLGADAIDLITSLDDDDVLCPEESSWSAERLAFEKEKLRLTFEFEKERMASQAAERELERERLAAAERMKKIDLEMTMSEQGRRDTFCLRKNVSLVPPFNEADPDGYFRNFEKTADHLQWPKTEWTWLLQTKLTGKAAVTFTNLNDTSDYDFVKKSILDAYSITPDGYRQKFRDLVKTSQETFVEFFTEKLRLFKKWLEATSTTDFDQLINIVVLEEAKKKLPLNIQLHIEEKGETDLMKAAQLADSYFLLLKSHSAKDTNKPFVKSSGSYSAGMMTGMQNDRKYCSYCKQFGHSIDNCKNPNCRKSINLGYQWGQSSRTWTNKNKSLPNENVTKLSNKSKSVQSIQSFNQEEDHFKNYKMKGFVSVDKNQRSHSVTILRDTGADQSLILKSCLPGIEHCYTGESVLCEDLSSIQKPRLVRIYINCDLIKGYVNVGVREKPFPVKGVGFLLANELAGSLVMPNMKVVEIPLAENPTRDLEITDPELFPMCAVTRSQSEKQSSPTDKECNLTMLTDLPVNKENLISAQEKDSSLDSIRKIAVENKNSLQKFPGYFYQDGILMRMFRPLEGSGIDSWSEIFQIVAPISIRTSLIELAHDGFSGHLGIRKTLSKLQQHFYWPGIRKSVQDFIKSCHSCQLVGKPNQVIPPAPLRPIPVVSEPFERIVIDCVGPLPRTKKGNEYLLTVMCTATRYPDAFPLKNINAKNISKCLVNMFTNVGIPKEIQCDQGSNFCSNLFKDVLKELGISQTVSSAYHPQSQGCLERFHQTFKSMLRKYCLETDHDWDEHINLLLFALRECPQESLGYSPFELLYGRQIRGPLKVLKDQWFSDDKDSPSIPVTQYVSNLKERLQNVRTLALNNLNKSQSKMKKQFDTKAKARHFFPGDEVLLFLPIPGNPLKSKFTGPYVISQKLSDLNYVVKTPDRRKDTQLVHVNLIKPYVRRQLPEDSKTSNVCVGSIMSTNLENVNKSDEVTDIPSPRKNPLNSEILSNPDTYFSYIQDSSLRSDIVNLFSLYPKVVSDFPGYCNLILHDVDINADCKAPIRQAAYRVNPAKLDILKQEVDYLLKHDLAEPSKSPWSSPCILVPKPDGSSRLCTDYRKLNQVTIPDAYPLPFLDSLIDAVGESKYITTIDMQKGYYQIGMTEAAKEKSAFITPFGLFQYKVLPFGMCNAPATFQRIINYVIQDLEGVYAYLDDILIISNSWADHLNKLKRLFDRLARAGLTINLAKSVFGQGQVEYLGHLVGGGWTRPKQANIEAMVSFPTPTDRKSLLRYLGMVGYYRRFCSNFSTIAEPLTNLTSPKVPFKWTPLCDEAFRKLKQFMISDPVLKTPLHDRPFTLQIDASAVGVGAVLLQENPSTGVLHPVCYYSAKLKKHQKNYSTIELEALSLVMALKRFEIYLHQHSYPVRIQTDHNPITFIKKMAHKNQRILRWAIEIQRFNLTLEHIKGKLNVIADPLSRDIH